MRRITVIFLLLLLSMTVYSEIVIEHSEPYIGYKGIDLKLDISITRGMSELQELNVYYRERGEVAFNVIAVDGQSGVNGDFVIYMPISKHARGLEYYLEALAVNGAKYTYPLDMQTLKPISVSIIEPVVENDFVVLNELDKIEEGSDFSLSISLYNIKDNLDYSTIKAYRDKRDVTKELLITPSLLVYSVNKINKDFNFKITANTLNGKPLESEDLRIKVKKKIYNYELPLNIRGNVNYKGSTTNISYDDETQSNSESSTNSHSTIVSVSGNYEFLSVNSRLYLSSLENSEKQSVNRYMFDAQIPHFKMYLGDTSPYLSEYTLNSTNIRGWGSRLYFKYLTLEGYMGNSAREISTKFNEDKNLTTPGTFKRETSAIRLAFGNHNAFQFGINVAKNKDKISSLKEVDYYIPITSTRPTKDDDADQLQIINPVDNIIFSTDFKITTPRKLYTLGAEVALSAYNSNIMDGVMTQEEIESDLGETIPFDPESIEDLFIINKNVEPFGVGLENMAYKVYTNAYIAGNFVTISLSRVGSAFNSLSARSVRNDAKEFTISDNINFHNTVFVDFSYNRVTDNLSKMLATTDEYSNYHVSSVFRKENLPILRANFDKGRTSVANNGSLNMGIDFDESQEFRTSTFGGGIGYDFTVLPEMPFSLDLDYAKNINEDDLRETFKFENDSYVFRYKGKLIPYPLSTEFSYNLTNSTNTTEEFRGNSKQLRDVIMVSEDWNRNSVRIKLAYELWDAKLIPFFDFKHSSNKNDLDGDKDYSQKATSIGFKFSPLKLTSINSNLTFKNNSYEIAGKDYSAVNWYMNIVQKF